MVVTPPATISRRRTPTTPARGPVTALDSGLRLNDTMMSKLATRPKMYPGDGASE